MRAAILYVAPDIKSENRNVIDTDLLILHVINI